MMKTATKTAITPRQIADAKQLAIDLGTAAYVAQPILQPDGTTIMLCLHGRVARAYDKLAEVRESGNELQVKRIEGAVDTLSQACLAATAAAEHAASDYTAICIAAGFPPDDVEMPVCGCTACVGETLRMSWLSAQAGAVEALYGLVAPNSVDVPPIVTLIESAEDEVQRKRLWSLLKRIADAYRAYESAAVAAGERVSWRGLLRGGE
jgi:hypothetical protein